MNDLHDNMPFKLYSDCLLTRGASRSIIMDTSRARYYHIPNDLEAILKTYDGQPLSHVLKQYPEEEHETIRDYFTFLSDHELIFNTSIPDQFPAIPMDTFEMPSAIYQAILDMDAQTTYDLSKTVRALNDLNCKYLDLRFFGKVIAHQLKSVLEAIQSTTIVGVTLFIPYDAETSDDLIHGLHQYLKLHTVFISGAPQDRSISQSKDNPFSVFYLQEELSGCGSCGVVSKSYFAINLPAVLEAKNGNSCLNKKISVDSKGYIRNCPSMKTDFGHISENTLEEALQNKAFQQVWSVTKDQVSVCRDCEYRYICTDCRAYLKDESDPLSQPLKCHYNPYTNEWLEPAGS